MPYVVRIPPLLPSAPGIRTGLPVRGESQWYQMAQQANWLLTAGGSLVIAGPEAQLLSVNTNYTFKFYAWPHAQNTYRMWVVGLGGDEDGASGTIKNIGATQTLATWSVPARDPGNEHDTPLIVVCQPEIDAAPAAGQIGLRVDIDANSPGEAKVQSIACYEVPIPWAAQATGHPDVELPDENLHRGGEPIYDDESTQLVGPSSIAATVQFIADDARRSCLASLWRLVPLHRVTATYAVPFGAAALPVLARRKYVEHGAAGRTIAVAVFLEGTGYCTVGATSGDSHEFTVTASGGAWVTTTLDVDAEDLAELATDGGLQSGARDYITIALKGDGAGGIYLYGFCAAETD